MLVGFVDILLFWLSFINCFKNYIIFLIFFKIKFWDINLLVINWEKCDEILENLILLW